MKNYLELGAAALLPAVSAVLLFMLNRRGKFNRIPDKIKMILIGILYGIFAILGTECGIPINGAQINCRDASVLIAGLFFGAPAGILAGIIGGAERWIAVAWGIGTYTRLACSLSTFLAGIFAAVIKKFTLENKKPSCGTALFVGISMEVFHLTMVFFTHMNDPYNAIQVIRSCTIPLVTANGLSVFLTAVLISIATYGNRVFHPKKKSETPVFETIQRSLLIMIAICLAATCLFVYRLENNLSLSDTDDLLTDAITDTADELEQKIDDYMLQECQQVERDMESGSFGLKNLAWKYGICEIFFVNSQGIITESNIADYIDYDMQSSALSQTFLCLLDTKTEYVQNYGTFFADEGLSRKCAGIRNDSGFLLITFDANGLYSIVSDQIANLVVNRHAGQSGYMVITDDPGNVVSSSTGFSIRSFARTMKNQEAAENTLGRRTIQDNDYYYRYQECEGYTIWAVYPVSEAHLQRDLMVYLTIFLLVLVFMGLYGLLYMLIKTIVVDQIVKMAGSLSIISSGNLNEVVDVRSNEEFASLSNDINHTVDTLKHYIAEAASRIDAELKMASTIQTSSLPNAENAFPKRKDFSIYAKMDPAKEVGGDFYDFYLTGFNEINIMIADVSGKGIPAAMFMMTSKSVLKDLTSSGLPVNQVFTIANNRLCSGNDAKMFVTAWQGKIHLDTGLVEFANAGHNAPLIKRGKGPFEFLSQKKNLVLAAIEDIPYRLNQLQLSAGDVLLLYTDGVVEATASGDQMYGNDRLLAIANSREFTSMKELVTVVRQDIDVFVGDAPQFDDLTMLAFRYNGPEELPEIIK